MITLYGVYRSRASRPLWLLAETGQPHTHVPVIQAYRLTDASAPDAPLNTASAAFLALNPMGQIPALTDDGLLLTESLAITLHIARRHGGLLGPRQDHELAQMEQWALFVASAVETPALEITYAKGNSTAEADESAAIIAIAAEKLRRPFAHMEAHLQRTGWMVGDRFTVADINAAECVRYAQGHLPLMAEFPTLDGWIRRCQERPAFKAMWAARLAEPA